MSSRYFLKLNFLPAEDKDSLGFQGRNMKEELHRSSFSSLKNLKLDQALRKRKMERSKSLPPLDKLVSQLPPET